MKRKVSGSYLSAGISVSMVLFMLGLFGLIFLQANALLEYMREHVNIIIELKRDTLPENREELEAYLQRSPYLKRGSLKYISREEAFRQMKEEFGSDIEVLEGINPMYDIYVFNVGSEYLDSTVLQRMRISLKSRFAFINDLYYQESLISLAAANLKKVGWGILGLGLLLSIIALLLIHNTIRLSLQENRFLIKNMQLVGASWDFISRPYLLKSALAGFISALIAIAVLESIRRSLIRQVPELAEVQDLSKTLLIYGSLLVIGILMYLLSTYRVVRKHLKMRVEDLY